MRHWIFEQFGKLIAESSKIMLEVRTDKNKIRCIKESASLKQTTKEKSLKRVHIAAYHTLIILCYDAIKVCHPMFGEN